MSTKDKIIDEYEGLDLAAGDEIFTREEAKELMDTWAKPAVDALRIIQNVYIPEILKLYEVEGNIPKELKKLISETLKQYNQ